MLLNTIYWAHFRIQTYFPSREPSGTITFLFSEFYRFTAVTNFVTGTVPRRLYIPFQTKYEAMVPPRNLRMFTAIMLMVAVLCTSQSGGELDTVILATRDNYPDAIIAGAGSDKAGIPVLLTPADELPEEVATFLSDTRPQNIILVGGSSVISTDIEEKLKADGFEVIRTWGVSRYGTAAEFATYMWQEGADEAVLVYDIIGDADGSEGYEHMQLSMAKGLASAKKLPVLLTSGDTLSSETSDAINELGVIKVFLVGTRFGENVTAELKTLGIEIEVISGEDEKEVIKKLEDKALEELKKEAVIENLVVIATGANDFLSAISMPNTADVSARKIISDEGEIPDVIEFVKANEIKNVKVVGIPELVSKVAAQLLLMEDIHVEALSTSNVEKKLVDFVERNKAKWKQKRVNELKKTQETLLEKRAQIAKRVAAELEKASALLDEADGYLLTLEAESESNDQTEDLAEAKKVLEEAKKIIAEAKEAFTIAEGSNNVDDYVRALQLVKKAFNLAKSASYEGANDFYGADAERKREVVDGFLDRESRNIEKFVEEFHRELDKFKEFYERAEEAGLLAEECSELVDEAEQLYTEGEEAFNANDNAKVKALASKIKNNLQKCVSLTMQKGEDDKEGLANFKLELKSHRKEAMFEDRIMICRDKCMGGMDRCMRRIGDCGQRCDGLARRCEEGTEKLRQRCDEQIDKQYKFDEIIGRCFEECDIIEDPLEAEYCYLKCDEIDEEGRRAVDECFQDVDKFANECHDDANMCFRKCEDMGDEKCRTELKECVPSCVGERFFTDPRFAMEVCHFKCEVDTGIDRDECHMSCEAELMARGEREDVKRTCMKEAHRIRGLCLDSCLDDCGEGDEVVKEVCRVTKKCEKTSTGEEKCKVVKECTEVTRFSKGLCKQKCEEVCEHKVKEFVYDCAEEKSDNIIGDEGVGMCQNACRNKSGRDRYECMDRCMDERRDSGDKAKRLLEYCITKTCADARDVTEKKLCVSKCMGKEREGGEEEKGCSRDGDCRDLMCPMMVGQDTQRCFDGMCVCGPSDRFLDNIRDDKPDDPGRICEEKCRHERDIDRGFCMRACMERFLGEPGMPPGIMPGPVPMPMPPIDFDPCDECKQMCKRNNLREEDCKEKCGDICRIGGQADEGFCGDGVCDYSVGEDCQCKIDCPCDLPELPVCDIGHSNADERGCRPAEGDIGSGGTWETSPCQQHNGLCLYWQDPCPPDMQEVDAPCGSKNDKCCMTRHEDEKMCGQVPDTFCAHYANGCPSGTYGAPLPCKFESEICCEKEMDEPPMPDDPESMIKQCIEHECRYAPTTEQENCKLECKCRVDCKGDYQCVEKCMGFDPGIPPPPPPDDAVERCIKETCPTDSTDHPRCIRKCECDIKHGCNGDWDCIMPCLEPHGTQPIDQGEECFKACEGDDLCKRSCECALDCDGEPKCLADIVREIGVVKPGDAHNKCNAEVECIEQCYKEHVDPIVGPGGENPAAKCCIEHGGKVDMQTDSAGNQAGICYLPDGRKIDAWKFFDEKCKTDGGEEPGCQNDDDCSDLKCVNPICDSSGTCVCGEIPKPTQPPADDECSNCMWYCMYDNNLPEEQCKKDCVDLCDDTRSQDPCATMYCDDDNDPCTKDFCEGGVCKHDPIPDCGPTGTVPSCGDGTCDNNENCYCIDCKCPEGENCEGGECKPEYKDPVCGDGRCDDSEKTSSNYCCEDCDCMMSGYECMNGKCVPPKPTDLCKACGWECMHVTDPDDPQPCMVNNCQSICHKDDEQACKDGMNCISNPNECPCDLDELPYCVGIGIGDADGRGCASKPVDSSSGGNTGGGSNLGK